MLYFLPLISIKDEAYKNVNPKEYTSDLGTEYRNVIFFGS